MRPQTEPPRPQSCRAIQWKWKQLHNILQPEAKNDESLKNWNTLSDVVPQTIVRWFVHPSGLQTTPNDYTFATHEIEQEKCIFFPRMGFYDEKNVESKSVFRRHSCQKKAGGSTALYLTGTIKSDMRLHHLLIKHFLYINIYFQAEKNLSIFFLLGSWLLWPFLGTLLATV